MAKSKLSISVDQEKLDRAQALVPTESVSELIDVALQRLIDQERERQHVKGYLRKPASGSVVRLAEVPRQPFDDDIDWAALYKVRRP